MSTPLRVAVVGQVDTGKTSLISTLARRADLRVGTFRTTETIQEVSFEHRGRRLLTLIDTPGFELAADISHELEQARQTGIGERRDGLQLLEDYLAKARDDESHANELDLRALEAALSADVILYVVNVRSQAPLERTREEIALLVRTARPVVGVMNFTEEAGSREAEWREAFRREMVHAVVAFDVMLNSPEAETRLFESIATLVDQQKRKDVEALLRVHESQRKQQAARARFAIAELLLDAVTMEASVPREGTDSPDQEAREALEQAVRAREKQGHAAIGRALGFKGEEVAAGGDFARGQVLEEDLFDPAALARHAPTLLGQAAGGAALGVGIDALVGGLTLGLGALIGGASGLVAGFLHRAVRTRHRRDLVIARLDPQLSSLLLARAMACQAAYLGRTHARRDREDIEESQAKATQSPDHAALLRTLTRAAEDEDLRDGGGDQRREETLSSLTEELERLLV